MEKVSISQLKNSLSAYLKKVRAGHDVLILDRGLPIARIERVDSEVRGGDRLQKLERAGLLQRARSPLPLKALRANVPGSSAGVTQALIDERRDGR